MTSTGLVPREVWDGLEDRCCIGSRCTSSPCATASPDCHQTSTPPVGRSISHHATFCGVAPRYLICRFPGGDRLEGREFGFEPVDRILERARSLSLDNDVLWSVALLLDDETIWLSGTNYPQVPATFRDLDGRYHMQNRYLLKRRHNGERPALLPDGRRVVTFITEYGWGLPLWQPGDGQVGKTDLPLSVGLVTDLEEFQRDFMDRGDGPLPAGGRDTIRDLYIRLCGELNEVAEVRLGFKSIDPFPLSLHIWQWHHGFTK